MGQYDSIMQGLREATEYAQGTGKLDSRTITTQFAEAISKPNKETIEAMEEAERIAHDPMTKAYTDVEEMMRDILDEDGEQEVLP